jgi:hypothetical protein
MQMPPGNGYRHQLAVSKDYNAEKKNLVQFEEEGMIRKYRYFDQDWQHLKEKYGQILWNAMILKDQYDWPKVGPIRRRKNDWNKDKSSRLQSGKPAEFTGPRGNSFFSAGFRELTDKRLGKEEFAPADHMLLIGRTS